MGLEMVQHHIILAWPTSPQYWPKASMCLLVLCLFIVPRVTVWYFLLRLSHWNEMGLHEQALWWQVSSRTQQEHSSFKTHIRAVYTRENKPRITQFAAYVSRELRHSYDNSVYKKLVRGLCRPRTCFLCRLYEQFAAYVSRGLCKPRIV